MYRVLYVFALSALILTALPAEAGNLNKRLKGSYSIATNRVCAQAQAGFTPEGIALSPVNEQTAVIERVNTYDGNGNVTSVGHAMQVNSNALNAGAFPTSESDFTCSGTYQVNEDNSFSETQTCSGTVLTGVVAGQTFTQTPGTLTGQVRGKHILIKDTSTATPVVITLSGAGSFTRLCGQAGSGIKIKSKE